MSTSATPGDAGKARQRITPDDSPRGGAATPRKTFLFLRIWMSSPPVPNSGSLSWRAENSLIQMIADLVSASGGSQAGKLRNGLIAGFRNAAEASAAAIRLQRAIAGFAAQSKASEGVAVALFSEDKAGGGLNESSDELETASFLAGAAQPEQILLTAGAYAELNLSAPYTSRRVVPFGLPAGIHSNLEAYQLAWNGASPASSEPTRTEKTTTSSLRRPRDRAADAAPRPRTATRAAGDGSSDVAPFAEPVAVPSVSRRRLPIYAGLAAAILVAMVAAGTWIFTSGPPAPTPTPQPSTEGVKEPPQATASEPNSKNPPPEKLEPEAPVSAPPMEGTGGKGSSVTTPPSPERPPAPKAQRPNAYGFFPSDIPGLLEKADRESGDGEYDAAERHYRIVLALERNNSRAQKGLARNAQRRAEQQ